MDSGNFLSPQTLDEIYGGGSLEGVLQGRQQVGLANQFQQQGLTANDLANKKAELANQFTIEDNPLKLENSRLTNTGLENKNTTEGVAARLATATEGMQLTQAQKDFAVKSSKADLDLAENHAVGILQDPFASRENKDAASKILDFTKAAVEARRANDLAKSLEHVRGNEHMRGVNAQTASAERINTANINAGKYDRKGAAKTGVGNIQSAVQSGKMSPANAAVALHGAAMFEPDPELQATYFQMASQYETLAKQLKPNPQENKLDIGSAAKLPTIPAAPPALNNPKAAPVQPTAPAAAIAHLKAHPELSGAFKAKYGYLP